MKTIEIIKTNPIAFDGKLEITIDWFGGTNEYGDCWYGFTPFGAYTVYELDSELWVSVSICGQEAVFDTKQEAIEAVEKDFKSRVDELLGKPYLPSERLENSHGWGEAEEFEISNEGVENNYEDKAVEKS